MKKLSEIGVGQVMIIHSFSHQIIARKLITMGVIPGKEVEILRKVPFQATLYIRVQDSHIAIRKAEAENIIISKNEQ
ncbi:MAG: FeoA family protein [Chitinophagales bacterium]